MYSQICHSVISHLESTMISKPCSLSLDVAHQGLQRLLHVLLQVHGRLVHVLEMLWLGIPNLVLQVLRLMHLLVLLMLLGVLHLHVQLLT